MSEAIVLIITILLPAVLSLVFLWLLIAPMFGYSRNWLDDESEKKTINIQNNTFYINHLHVGERKGDGDQKDGEDLSIRKIDDR